MIERIKADETALAAAEAGDWAACADRLNAIAQPTRKPLEKSRYSWVGLQKELGNQVFGTIRTKLEVAEVLARRAQEAAEDQAALEAASAQVARLKSLQESMASSPPPAFADPQTQDLLDSLRDVLSAEEVAALKSLGIIPPRLITAQECQTAWEDDVTNTRITTNQADFDTLWNEHASPVLHDRVAFAEALRTIATALEG